MLALTPLLEHKKNILWDWNGTLLDDVGLCVNTINSLLSEKKLAPITEDSYRLQFRFPVIEYYRTLGFNFAASEFEKLAEEWMRRYNEAVPLCPLFQGSRELLGELSAQGKRQLILSAAKESAIIELTEHHRIRTFLEAIYGLKDNLARGKVERAQDLIREMGLRREETILVGDTDHDIEVAKHLGIDALILADGHQAPERLVNIHKNVVLSRFG